MTVSSSRHRREQTYDGASTKTSIGSGVGVFAGVMLTAVAVFQILEGIAAIANNNIYVRGVSYTYKFDVSTWGWVHLLLGVIALVAGAGIVMAKVWAEVTGIGIACIIALANFAFLPHYPIWSIVVIAFNILVVWALCTQIKASTKPRA